MKRNRILSLLLCSALLLTTAAGCRRADPTPGGSQTPGASSAPSASQSQPVTPGEETPVRLVVLSGPTGMGAAKLMADNDQSLSKNRYDITVAAANEEVTAMLTGAAPEADIAALATNVAANLFNKTGGEVQMLAVNTLGVLYLLEKGDTVQSLADLRGKTIYATGQGANPEYILSELLEKSGLDPAKDVTIQWMTAQEVTAKMATGTQGVCMLPVPAATALLLKDSGVRQALDLSAEWESAMSTALPMGCVVARTRFIQENPQKVADFLEDYQASLTYMTDPANLEQPEAASPAALATEYGITANAKIAAAALPQCNLTFLMGQEMQETVQSYYEVLFRANPAAIGGSIPYDTFYYQP